MSERGWLWSLGLHRRELRSWAFYDWANSAFATTIMAALLPIYYVRVAASGLPPNVATAYWGYTAAAALAVVAVISPLLGAMADFLGAKKKFLGGFMALGVAATAALVLVDTGEWPLASALYLLGNIGFTGSIVFYSSLLPHIAADDEVDRVSAGGWAMGYVGGGLLLAVHTVMILRPGLFGLDDVAEATRWAFVSVAVWWALFSIPLFRDVREPPRRLAPGERPDSGALRASVRRLVATFREVRRYSELWKLLIAYWFYADGIGTIIKMATAYGAELGLSTAAMIGALLVVQFVGVPFTFAFGALADRIGAQRGIYITLVVYTLIAVTGYFMREAWHFWALAFGVGMVQGGAQALSRSLFATLVPRGASSEFFGFFSVFEKFAGILGPLLFGVVSMATGTSRLGILALIVFFVGGMLLLARVDVEKGRRVARLHDRPGLDAAPAGG